MVAGEEELSHGMPSLANLSTRYSGDFFDDLIVEESQYGKVK